MGWLRSGFLVDLLFVICTIYIVISYLLIPSNNQCQMTFMMEPPQFVPIPLDDMAPDLSSPHGASLERIKEYTLHMYSEFGFPSVSNVRRDLRDSMPVLFVPGNAGSYQQVRSLASTCIRRQLQSLDAFKFIFYTIDFKDQLSGISGQMIEDQTLFVQKSLNQIIKLHSSETNGVILIGHSVGGFISKALFALPNFNFSSVPLLISLASPLTKPYLSFDSKMLELYTNTNKFWDESKSDQQNTVSLSIGGGRADLLVPTHLSIDPQYDISLTTSSIRDVWMTTDHVSITWCRELMHKLAQLLSALMDKKQTRLITDKDLAKSIIMKELLSERMSSNQGNLSVIHREWKTARAHKIVTLEGYYSISRSQLEDRINIVDVSQSANQHILIRIDHLDSLKENGIFACQTLMANHSEGQFNCVDRVQLMHLAVPIPTRRFEPKKSVLRIATSERPQIDFIVVDFSNYAQNQVPKIPELVSVQVLDHPEEKMLYIPSLIEFAFKKFSSVGAYEYSLISYEKFPLNYVKYRIHNLKHNTQVFSLRFESQNCTDTEVPHGASILLFQGNHLSESFHPVLCTDKKTLATSIRLSSQQLIAVQGKTIDFDSYLEFYIDGTCGNSLKLELDVSQLITSIIQRSLVRILVSASHFAHMNVLLPSLAYREDNSPDYKYVIYRFILTIVGYIYIFMKLELSESGPTKNEVIDIVTSLVLIYIITQGALAILDCLVRRLVDLASIVNKIQSSFKRKIKIEPEGGDKSTSIESADSYKSVQGTIKNSLTLNVLLSGLAVAGAFYSKALVSLVSLFIVVKLQLFLQSARAKLRDQHNLKKKLSSEVSQKEVIDINHCYLHEQLIGVAVFCSISLLANIPTTLIRLSSRNIKYNSLDRSIIQFFKDLEVECSLLQVLLMAYRIESSYSIFAEGKQTKNSPTSYFISSALYHAMFALLALPLIADDVSSINLVFLLAMLWFNSNLNRLI